MEAREDMLDFERKMAAAARRRGRRVKAMALEDGIPRRATSLTTFCMGPVATRLLGITMNADKRVVKSRAALRLSPAIVPLRKHNRPPK